MNALLKLENINKKFGGIVTAKNICMEARAGEIHGLIGPNGAGKTTMMNLISGIYPVDGGKIFFDGRDITNIPAHLRARLGIGRTFQTPRFLHRSNIRDNLMLGVDAHAGIGHWASFLGLHAYDFQKELEELMEMAGFSLRWDDDISSIPFGQQKLLEIVRSLLMHPKMILVDEPAAGLTTGEIKNAKKLLSHAAKEKNVSILLIEHQMDLVMTICDTIDVLVFGEIVAEGRADEIVSNPLVIEAYLGRDIDAAN